MYKASTSQCTIQGTIQRTVQSPILNTIQRTVQSKSQGAIQSTTAPCAIRHAIQSQIQMGHQNEMITQIPSFI